MTDTDKNDEARTPHDVSASELSGLVMPKRYSVSKDPIIAVEIASCLECGEILKTIGIQKPMHPPLDVVQCNKCELEYWRRTEA